MRFLDAVSAAQTIQSSYYEFLFLITREKTRVVEIGTDSGGSANQMASANDDNLVVTVDANPACRANIERFGRKNIVFIEGLFADVVEMVRPYAPFDLLFVDGTHRGEDAWMDYAIYRTMVKHGGLILFDDIHYSPSMTAMWESIPETKSEANWLHSNSGFGLVEKNDNLLIAAPR